LLNTTSCLLHAPTSTSYALIVKLTLVLQLIIRSDIQRTFPYTFLCRGRESERRMLIAAGPKLVYSYLQHVAHVLAPNAIASLPSRTISTIYLASTLLKVRLYGGGLTFVLLSLFCLRITRAQNKVSRTPTPWIAVIIQTIG
jgi:hypothetical protein